ncbi:substrate-binding domain-containing protein [Solicola gregarius]|uniref:Substrate-binding and VWA domain-containing protein n=1 Tax=Solicola gregarius TaxID=2908642 RepID=A0AA46TG65_9ACTN|nr:substrate-binding domain-containing protein [Solicola gregarius]UYM03968.1 substrate-binding and VWA domain-containing protein [Solicola gregarius]
MEGRHSAADRGTSRRVGPGPLVLGAAVIAFVVAVGLVIRWQTAGGGDAAASADSCGETVAIAASPDIADVVDEVVASSDDGCGTYEVEASSAADVAKALTSGEGMPDAWIPDSTVEVDRVAGVAATAPVVLEASLASSPVVVVGSEPAESSWRDVLAADDLSLGDPTSSTPAVMALIAARAEAQAAGASDDELKQDLVSVAQSGASSSDGSTAADQVTKLASDGGTAVASEQSVLANRSGAAKNLRMSVPDSGTLSLDYPLVLSASSERRDSTSAGVDALSIMLTSAQAQDAFAKAGFRSPEGAPVDDGVGDVKSSPMPRTDEVASLLSAWTLLSRPSRTLAVIDVSGSMQYAAGDSSRMALTVDAANAGRELFPDGSAMGLWAFSVGLGENGKDYLPLVPVRRLDAAVGGSSQRDVLEKATAGLIGRTGGGTGLYDSILAAYRAAQEGYDPKAVNSVVLLTDGENEDPGSIGLDKLLDTLESEADPDRPVVIVTIGITEDADVSALEAIAHETGGTSHVAVDPDDIANVFVEALANRG